MTTELVYAANIIQEIQALEKQCESVTSTEEKTVIVNKIEQLRLIIKDVEFTFYEPGRVKREAWVKDGKFHRDGGSPAIVTYFYDGQIQYGEWRINGKLHRSDGAPAAVSYYKTGQLQSNAWYKDGKHHRIDAPAAVSYYKTGQLQYEGWYKYGKLHRPNGAPAVILYFENGQIEDVKWYEDGNEIFYRRYIKYFADIVTYICHGKK